MKRLSSPIMRHLLEQGLRKAKRARKPKEGQIVPLDCQRLSNGWYYQVDYEHDWRLHPQERVIVYAFKPGNNDVADYYLEQQA